MIKQIVGYPFRQFNRDKLDENERSVLDGGIVKHISILKLVSFFLVPKIALVVIAPEIFILLSAVSFISLMLGTVWYSISFQNVSEHQLVAGVADFITKKMFRAFMLSFDTLIICTKAFVIKMLMPELTEAVPEMKDIALWFRTIVMVTNLAWILIIFIDVYFASVTYDAADSLLGDGFPTLMRGARANADNLPMLNALQVLIQLNAAACKSQGVDIGDIEGLDALDEK